MLKSQDQISVSLKEKRIFKPSRKFSEAAVVNPQADRILRKSARVNPEKYWKEAALELHWFKSFKKTLDWKPPFAKWFVGGKMNASYNCLDRHLETQAQKLALVWEGEPGEAVHWTYKILHTQVEKLTAVLRQSGLKKGDRVAIYMPMVPEAVVAMLACARGGFVHTVVFGGFSSEALKDRIQDAEARLVISADGGYRKGTWINLHDQLNRAIPDCPSVESTLILKRSNCGRTDSGSGKIEPPTMRGGMKEFDYFNLVSNITPNDRKKLGYAEKLDSEHPLFILYTSGTTGKPKGILHTTAGYLTGVHRTFKTVFDIKANDLFWCTADIGWVTGHSYLVYGPLAAGASVLLFEGAPTHPQPDRMWSMIERHQVTILYTAPTAIRALMRLGDHYPKAHDLSSLRLLGTVGEPINPEAWMWYHDKIGGRRCPIVDTYWQTETGAIVISPLPGVVPTKPGSATLPLPGYDVEVVDKKGNPVAPGSGGYLVIRKPWPAMARTIYKDPARFKSQYWTEFPGIYFTGDGARKDNQGYIWCLGRVDDVLNVSGHRLGTMEIESALVSHPSVAEAAVVGRPDNLKGQAVVAFVTLKRDASIQLSGHPNLMQEMRDVLKAHVVKEIGALARPDDVRFTDSLPKTRSGKIMRRLLRELATSGGIQGDTTTLEDLSVITALQNAEDEA